MNPERLVLDTNVLISAFLSPLGKPYACLDWALDNAILLTSRALLSELEVRLARPKFDKYLDAHSRRALVGDIALSSVQIEVAPTFKVCRDPDDDKLLDIAIAGRAHCLISGDQDLLVLNPFLGLPILSPTRFLASRARSNP